MDPPISVCIIPSAAMAKDDLARFCLPDFSQFLPGIKDVGPAFMETIQFLLGAEWLQADLKGSKEFEQSPLYIFWANLNLCAGFCVLPCCMCVTNARAMSKITGRTCESETLICCALNCVGLYPCYKAKTHMDLRKKYGIKGAPVFDCLSACCWVPCLVCQEVNELQPMGQLHVPYCNEPISSAVAPTRAAKASGPAGGSSSVPTASMGTKA